MLTVDKFKNKEGGIIYSWNYNKSNKFLSGGAVYDARYIAWGIHTNGFGINQYNSGVRINAGLFSLLKEKRKESVNSLSNNK